MTVFNVGDIRVATIAGAELSRPHRPSHDFRRHLHRQRQETRSAGHEVVFSGDLIHSPVQCRHPEWRAESDWNPGLAEQTRRMFLEGLADTDTFAATAHFPEPSVGRIVSRGDAFDFVPI